MQAPQAPSLHDILEDAEEENDLTQVIKTFLAPENIHHLSELTPSEITAISTLTSLAERHDIEPLQKWLVHNLKLRVSKSRAGRKEFVTISRRNEPHPPNNLNRPPGFFRREY